MRATRTRDGRSATRCQVTDVQPRAQPQRPGGLLAGGDIQEPDRVSRRGRHLSDRQGQRVVARRSDDRRMTAVLDLDCARHGSVPRPDRRPELDGPRPRAGGCAGCPLSRSCPSGRRRRGFDRASSCPGSACHIAKSRSTLAWRRKTNGSSNAECRCQMFVQKPKNRCAESWALSSVVRNVVHCWV